MKNDIFNQYVDRVTDLFGITKEDLFVKSKKTEFVDARHLIYYLCSKRPMKPSYIQKYMKDNGLIVHHASLYNGIKNVENRLKEDNDYVSIVKDIENSVFII